MANEPDLTFSKRVQDQCGEPTLTCYYCQKCTAGCPVAFAMDHTPAQVLRLVQLGQKDAVLASSAIWFCVSCETCGTRCPNKIRLAPMFDTLRGMALAGGYRPEPTVYALHRSFLDSIRQRGRVHELSMVIMYKLRSPFGSDLMADIKMGLVLFLKGKIVHLPERIHGLAQVRKLFDRSADRPAAEVGT